MRFEEVADRVWVLRHEWYDLNITAIGGERGVVVVDTHASDPAAREVIDAFGAIGTSAPVALVNTHQHFDHTFGNGAFRAAFGELPIHATEVAAERTVPDGDRIKALFAATDDPRGAEVIATAAVPADHVFSSAAVIDLGDRQVELVHPGRGHTAGDLVVRIPDADVLLAGDLVEESAPPSYGEESWPLEWPATLDLVLGLTTPSTVVVPGHGGRVDRRFVEDQADDLRAVAETARDLVARGVAAADAVASAEWPFEPAAVEQAVARVYATLPRPPRQLPLV